MLTQHYIVIFRVTISFITLLIIILLPWRAEWNLQYGVITFFLPWNSTIILPPLSLLKNLFLYVKITALKTLVWETSFFNNKTMGKKETKKERNTNCELNTSLKIRYRNLPSFGFLFLLDIYVGNYFVHKIFLTSSNTKLNSFRFWGKYQMRILKVCSKENLLS